jgi:hypothetical protein
LKVSRILVEKSAEKTLLRRHRCRRGGEGVMLKWIEENSVGGCGADSCGSV